jgi:protein translocase SecG subunit
MNIILFYLEIIVSVLLIVSIVFQQRGSSMGSAFGGGSQFYATRRGFEKRLFWATIVLAGLFLGLGIANLIFI